MEKQVFNTYQEGQVFNIQLRDCDKPASLQIALLTRKYLDTEDHTLKIETENDWGLATNNKHGMLPHIVKGHYYEIVKLRQYISKKVTENFKKYYPNIVITY